jgi:hypothetical protein
MQDLYITIYSSLQTLYIYISGYVDSYISGYFDLKLLITNKIYKQEIYRHKKFTNIIFYLICQLNIREII